MTSLSIIVPIYNVKTQYFTKCMESICNQSLWDIEIILIDDGSTEECAALCDKYAESDSRIKVIHQKNSGVSVARNRGISYANGKYIMFVDADDMISEDVCKNSFQQMEKYNDDILIFKYVKTEKELGYSQGKELIHKQFNEDALDKYELDIIMEKDSIENYNMGSPWGKTFRREFLKENSLLFIERLNKMEDRLFVLYCFEQKPRIGLLDYIGYYYNMNDESVSVKLDSKIENVSDRIIREINKFNSIYKRISTVEMVQLYILLLFKCLYSNCFHYNNTNKYFSKISQLRAISEKEPYRYAIKTVPLYTQRIKRKLIIILLRVHMYGVVVLYINIRNLIQKSGVK